MLRVPDVPLVLRVVPLVTAFEGAHPRIVRELPIIGSLEVAQEAPDARHPVAKEHRQ